MNGSPAWIVDCERRRQGQSRLCAIILVLCATKDRKEVGDGHRSTARAVVQPLVSQSVSQSGALSGDGGMTDCQ